jgi:hypothetical protein
MPRKTIFILSAIFLCMLSLSYCMNAKSSDDPRGGAYAGQGACVKCHASICSTYLQTAHYQSAVLASPTTIAGNFSTDSNSFIVNDSMKVVMEIRHGIPFQVLYCKGKEKRAERFDIVFGKAKGQTYLYWKGDLLFQLPVSYLTVLNSWTSSPGYPQDTVIFDRPIYSRCFECHASFVRQKTQGSSIVPGAEALDKSSMICQIDCERCHGPAAAHVNFQTANPDVKAARYIVSYRALSRSQKIDICAVCHSGNNGYMLKSTFRFLPGDTLSHFMLPGFDLPKLDVHGNQTQLLASSKCFRMSNMDCSTCHNTHIDDRGNTAKYARHCQDCHSASNHNFCKLADSSNLALLKDNCTRCHMPEQTSGVIKVKTSNFSVNTPISMVNHRIAVYPDESKKIMTFLKGVAAWTKK